MPPVQQIPTPKLEDQKRKASSPVLITVGLLLVLGIVGYYFFGNSTKEYTIPGVPYWGTYTGTRLNTSAAFATYTLLQYWGDKRFTPDDIAEEFPPIFTGIQNPQTYPRIDEFFVKNEYEVEDVPAEKLKEIKGLINKGVPVILKQKITPETPFNEKVEVLRVFIGYSDKRKVLIAHDNNFGNNYEITYSDFNELNDGISYGLIVRPNTGLEVSGPNTSVAYPPRKPTMDSESMKRIQIYWATIDQITFKNEKKPYPEAFPQIRELWEKIFAEEDFNKLHPAGRVLASYTLAIIYTRESKEHQKAINILNQITIPLLSQKFSEPFGDWERTISQEVYESRWWYISPKFLLATAYFRAGNETEARKIYKDVLDKFPNHPVLKELLVYFRNNLPEENAFLEKNFSTHQSYKAAINSL